MEQVPGRGIAGQAAAGVKMAVIRFLSAGVDVTVRCAVRDGKRRTVLAIAQQQGIPLPFRCGAGECTACLVHVETRAAGARPVAQPTDKEQSLLVAMYLLSTHDIESARQRGVSPDVRLACQYAVNDEDLTVFFQRVG